MKITTQPQEPPAGLLDALQAAAPRLHYTDPVCLYHYISSNAMDSDCGVFGDGDNAAYEWFTWKNGVLETSDVAYGMPEIALRDVLNKVHPLDF